ncbi:hypothetical protein BCR44DRAFT_1455533, partial [Catenaria anguillulae PL171]
MLAWLPVAFLSSSTLTGMPRQSSLVFLVPPFAILRCLVISVRLFCRQCFPHVLRRSC